MTNVDTKVLFRRSQIILCKTIHWLEHKGLWNRPHQDDQVIDNIFVLFGGRASQQQVDITLVSNWIPLLSFIRMVRTLFNGFTNTNEKKLAWSFNFTFRYKDDVLSRNNFKFGEHATTFQQHLHMGYIYLHWYSRACGFLPNGLDIRMLITWKQLNQWFLLAKV